MSTSPRLSAVTLVALVALPAIGFAAPQANRRLPLARPPGRVSLNLATGEEVRGAPDRAATLVPVWINTDWSGYYSSAYYPAEEWFNWGTMPGGGLPPAATDIVGHFEFAYGTTRLDTSVGGPGVTICMGFYGGATGCCAESGLGLLPDAEFCFSGLAGATNSSTPASWIYSITASGGHEFVLPDGAFAYSLRMFDTQTGPLLCYCGGTWASDRDANGQQGMFDVYVPDVATGTCGCYWFPTPPFVTSWWNYIMKENGPPASYAWYCGSGTNCNGYVVLAPVSLGGSFVSSVTACGGNTGAFLAAYFAPLLLSTAWGELLVDIADPNGELLGLPLAFGDPAILALSVPINLSFAGLTIYVQAAGFGGSIRLHCAYACTIGS
ncbi:MAG: hypothetical protein AB1726_16785 [Planctomycetota bacterium]